MLVSFSRLQFRLSVFLCVVHLFPLPRKGFWPPSVLEKDSHPPSNHTKMTSNKNDITQKWKTTKMEDDQNERRPKWKTTKSTGEVLVGSVLKFEKNCVPPQDVTISGLFTLRPVWTCTVKRNMLISRMLILQRRSERCFQCIMTRRMVAIFLMLLLLPRMIMITRI